MNASDRLPPRRAAGPDIEDFHHLLLRVDSLLPDELVVAARTWLADGLTVDIATSIVFNAISVDVPLASADAELLGRTLRDSGAGTAGMAQLRRFDVEEVPSYQLAPVDPAALAQFGSQAPQVMDLTAPHVGPGGPDSVDEVAIAVVAQLPALKALWRSWRYPAQGSHSALLAKRAYLVQVDNDRDGAALATTAARIQAELVAAGEADPLVRVFADAGALSQYHRMALRYSALLWTAQPQPMIRIARDGATTDPTVGPDAPPLDEYERATVLAYLAGGTPLLITAELSTDMIDPSHPMVVPTNVRTDGEWVWRDSVSYYLDRYRLNPEVPFLAHVRYRRHVSAELDVVALHRSLAVVFGVTAPAPIEAIGRHRRETANDIPTVENPTVGESVVTLPLGGRERA